MHTFSSTFLNNAEIVSVLGEIRTLFQHFSGVRKSARKSVRDSGGFRLGFALVWRKMRKSVRDLTRFRHVLRTPRKQGLLPAWSRSVTKSDTK